MVYTLLFWSAYVSTTHWILSISFPTLTLIMILYEFFRWLLISKYIPSLYTCYEGGWEGDLKYGWSRYLQNTQKYTCMHVNAYTHSPFSSSSRKERWEMKGANIKLYEYHKSFLDQRIFLIVLKACLSSYMYVWARTHTQRDQHNPPFSRSFYQHSNDFLSLTTKI